MPTGARGWWDLLGPSDGLLTLSPDIVPPGDPVQRIWLHDVPDVPAAGRPAWPELLVEVLLPAVRAALDDGDGVQGPGVGARELRECLLARRGNIIGVSTRCK